MLKAQPPIINDGLLIPHFAARLRSSRNRQRPFPSQLSSTPDRTARSLESVGSYQTATGNEGQRGRFKRCEYG